MKTAVSIAWRFLTFSKWQSLFIILGIAVGVAVQMFVGLLIDSLQSNLIKNTVGSSPHITIRAREEGELVKNPEELAEKIRTQVTGIAKIETTVDGNVIAIGSEENFPASFKGIERGGSDLFRIRENLKTGNFIRSSKDVVIGSELAAELSIKPGDIIRIADGSGRSSDLRVSGIFATGVAAIDKTRIAGDIRLVQSYFNFGKDATGVVMQTEDIFGVAETKKQIENLLDTDKYETVTWQEENAQLLTALSSQSSSSFMIQFFVLVSVTIAIASILSVTVLQKSRQIGILKAMGLTNRQAITIFLTMSAILGVAGATVGSFLGFGLFFSFTNGPRNPDGTPIFSPVIRWFFVYATWAITVVSATLAGVFPARRSAKLSPVEIIQNG